MTTEKTTPRQQQPYARKRHRPHYGFTPTNTLNDASRYAASNPARPRSSTLSSWDNNSTLSASKTPVRKRPKLIQSSPIRGNGAMTRPRSPLGEAFDISTIRSSRPLSLGKGREFKKVDDMMNSRKRPQETWAAETSTKQAKLLSHLPQRAGVMSYSHETGKGANTTASRKIEDPPITPRSTMTHHGLESGKTQVTSLFQQPWVEKTCKAPELPVNGSQRIVKMIQEMRGDHRAAQNPRDKYKGAGPEDEILSRDRKNTTHNARDAMMLCKVTVDGRQRASISKVPPVKNVQPNLHQQPYQSTVVNTTSEGSWPGLKYFANGTKPMEHNSEDFTLYAGFDDENGSIVVLRGDTEVLSIKPQDCHSVHWDGEDDQKSVKLSLRGQRTGLNGSILLVFFGRQGCIEFMDSLRRTGYIKVSVKSSLHMQMIQQRMHDLCTLEGARLNVDKQSTSDETASILPPIDENSQAHTTCGQPAHKLRNSMRDDSANLVQSVSRTTQDEENKKAKRINARSGKIASLEADRIEAEHVDRAEGSATTSPVGSRLRARAVAARVSSEVSAAASPPLDFGPEWLRPVLYPREPPTAATVHFQELGRLEEGQWLNDSLIEFSLRYVQGQRPQLRKDVYIFNTYFYASLTGNTGKSSKNAINYEAVRRWTSKIKLFEYNYVVVPINKNLHWYLAIICNLRNVRKTLGFEDDEAQSDIFSPMHGSGHTSAFDGKESMMDTSTKHMLHLSLRSSSDPADQIDEAVRKPKLRPGSRLQPHDVAIITLDSLENPHPNIVNNLNQYLAAEAQDKIGARIGKLPGVTAKGIPTQDNAHDCGLYAIEYIRYFMKDPEGFVGKILQREWIIKPDWQNFEPLQMRRQLLNVLKDEYKDQADVRDRDREAKRAARQHAVNNQKHQEKDNLISATKTTQISPSQMPWADTSRTNVEVKGKDGRAEVSDCTLLVTPTKRAATRRIIDELQVGATRDRGTTAKSSGPATFAELDDALRPEAAAALKPPVPRGPSGRLGHLESFEFSESSATSSPMRTP